MKLTTLKTDEAILSELGARLARRRLDLQLTQAELAQQAGVAKRTVERIEAGASAQLSSLLRIFRVLDLMSGLEQLVAETGPRPMELLQLKGRTRQRASSHRPAADSAEPWTWDDDT